MSKLKIAVVSDLHIGDTAREFDLRPNGQRPHPAVKGYMEQLESFLMNNEITADVLVASGDITNKAQPSEFRLAATIIKQIAQALKVSTHNIIMVPGNHDLNWDVAKLSASSGDDFWRQYAFAPFAMGQDQATEGNGDSKSLIDPPHFAYTDHEMVDIWSFNSAAYDMPDRMIHRGEILEEHRQKLETTLDSIYGSAAKKKFRIFVTHHHPITQPELYPDQEDFSAMVNGDALLDLLRHYKFDLILHGHKHRPWLKASIISGSNPITRWCSGSFSQTLPTAYSDQLSNLWHLVEFHDTKTEYGAGVIKSWAYSAGQGWLPSRPSNNGIDHVTPFGYIQDREVIKSKMRSVIASLLEHGTHIEWSKCTELDQDLRYQVGSTIWNILQEISTELSIRPHGDKDSLEDLVILKVAGS